MQKTIDIQESLQFGWDTLKANFTLFLKLLVVWIVISIIPAILIGKIATAAGPMLGIPLQFLNLIWQAVLGMGVIKIGLKLHDHESVEISDLWASIPKALDYVIVKFLFTLITTIGFILLIIPGCIWFLQFYLAGYLVVDKGEPAIAALKHSSAVTDGAKWSLAAFVSVMLVINIIGMVVLGVGLLITLPVTLLASIHMYRKLLAQA